MPIALHIFFIYNLFKVYSYDLISTRYYINYKMLKKKVKQYSQQIEGGAQDPFCILKDFSRTLDKQVWYYTPMLFILNTWIISIRVLRSPCRMKSKAKRSCLSLGNKVNSINKIKKSWDDWSLIHIALFESAKCSHLSCLKLYLMHDLTWLDTLIQLARTYLLMLIFQSFMR